MKLAPLAILTATFATFAALTAAAPRPRLATVVPAHAEPRGCDVCVGTPGVADTFNLHAQVQVGIQQVTLQANGTCSKQCEQSTPCKFEGHYEVGVPDVPGTVGPFRDDRGNLSVVMAGFHAIQGKVEFTAACGQTHGSAVVDLTADGPRCCSSAICASRAVAAPASRGVALAGHVLRGWRVRPAAIRGSGWTPATVSQDLESAVRVAGATIDATNPHIRLDSCRAYHTAAKPRADASGERWEWATRAFDQRKDHGHARSPGDFGQRFTTTFLVERQAAAPTGYSRAPRRAPCAAGDSLYPPPS